jgi:hypothetical protein
LQVIGAAAGVSPLPLLDDLDRGTQTGGWIVTVFDNDRNTYEQVMTSLMFATGCSAEEAYLEAWEIDHLGKSVVHYAGEKECRDAAEIIGRIGIKVTVSEE